MADRQTPSRRSRADRPASRRTDVIRCERCGEDYSVTYKRCPFCDEPPTRSGSTGRRVANTRGGGYGRQVNPIQIIGLIVSLILIIAALFIILTKIGPLLNPGKKPSASSSSGQSSASQSAAPSQSAVSSGAAGSASKPDGSASTPTTTIPLPVLTVEAISLSKTDVTLAANESYALIAAVSPSGVTETVEWSSSDQSVATVDAKGVVTNVNSGGARKTATITASCGGQTATCTVRCNGGSTGSGGGTVAANSTGIISADTGLNVRSGPGSSYQKIASVANGSKVTILEDAGNGWYKIEYSPGKTGYVSADYVKVGG